MSTLSDYSNATKQEFLSLGGALNGTISSLTDTPVAGAFDNSRIHFLGAPTWDRGAHLVLNGKGNEYKGEFTLTATDGVSYGTLRGCADSSLFWNGLTVERVNSHGWNYLRLESGTQFCWGSSGTGDNGGVYITYPVPFNGNAPLLLTSVAGSMSASGSFTMILENINASAFNAWSYHNGGLARGIGFYWYAVGRWK